MIVTAVILAAGRSTRFGGGRDKLMAEWRGLALIEYPIRAASAARSGGTLADCLVVTRPGSPAEPLARRAGMRVVHPDPSDGTGLAASLKAGFRAVSPETDAVVILLGDQPTITDRAIDAVVAAGSPDALVRARSQGDADASGHPVLIGRRHFDLVGATEGDRGLQAVARARRLAWTEVTLDGPNPDVDVPADLDRLG